MNTQGKTSALLVVGAVALIAILGLIAWQMFGTTQQTIIVPGPEGTGSTGGNVAVNPTASYATVDKFGTATVTGTSYYKQGNSPVTTTAYSNVNPGSTYTYWVSNSTLYYVKPITFTATTLNNPIINKIAYQNTSISLSSYDNTNRQVNSASAYNTSLSANGQANIEIDYQPVSKKSFMPFGGLMVVEMNASINSVTCSGEGITAGAGDKHLTYTVANTNNKYVVFTLPEGFDDGVNTALRRVTCQFQNGGSAVGNAVYYIKIIPFNYYVSNAGDILLDAEQYANDATTKTGFGQLTLTNYWS